MGLGSFTNYAVAVLLVSLLAILPVSAQVWPDHLAKCVRISQDNGTTTTCICQSPSEDFLFVDTDCDGVVDAESGTGELLTEQRIAHHVHETDCTLLIGTGGLPAGESGELCYQQADDKIFICEPTAGNCDTALEWIEFTAGGAGTITAVFNCAGPDCEDITMADGDSLNASGISLNAAGEGIIVTKSGTCDTVTGVDEGTLCYDTDSDALCIMGSDDVMDCQSFGASGDVTKVGDCGGGDCFDASVGPAIGTKLDSDTDFVIEIDADNNGTETFQIKDGAGTTVVTVTEAGDVSAASLTLDPNATPGIDFKDSECTDDEVNVQVDVNCTTTATTAEDCDYQIQQYIDGNMANVLNADADPKTLTLGSAVHDSLTVTTDSTGTAEVVLPPGSIDSTEILDDSVDYPDLDYTNEIAAADVGLGVDECYFVADAGGSGGGFVCEGSTADANETEYFFQDGNEADVTHEIVTLAQTQTLTNKTIDATNTVTINASDITDQNANTDITADLEEEGEINATAVTGNAADDQVILGSGASAAAYATIPDCNTNNMLTYTQSTNTWGCDADDGAGGGAPTSVQYVVGASDATLTAEKILTDGQGIDTVLSGGDAGAATIDLLYTDTLAGNPSFDADECVFSSDGTGGVLLCEGTTDDAFEGLIVWPVASSDKTLTLPNATDTLVGRDTTDTLTNKTIDATNTVTINASDITDLSGNTDITADLEEETHASEHQNGGGDEVATATPGANAIPKAEADGDLANGWIGLDQSYAWTGDHDFGSGGIEIENGTVPPACTVGQLYLDTDASTGQQLMACEGGTFVVQGDGVGGAGVWNDADPIDPATSTRDVHIGDGAGTLTGKLEVGGDDDQPQLIVEGHSSQTDSLVVFQNDADAELFNFDIISDHNWASVTSDLKIGDADEGQIKIGTAYIGQADETITGTTLDDTMVLWNTTDTVNNMSFMFAGGSNVPRFVIVEEGAGLATYNPRSFIIGGAADFTTGDGDVDDNINCTTNNYFSAIEGIDCNTSTTGADLLVQDDALVQGQIFIGEVIDAIGAVDMDYGSADVTDHTFRSDDGTIILDGAVIMGDNSVTGVDTITFTDVNGTIAGVENQNIVDKSATEAITGDWDFSGGGIEIENGTTPPACTVGQLYLDTDATSGQQLYACEGGTFVLQGDGSGGGNRTNVRRSLMNHTVIPDTTGNAYFETLQVEGSGFWEHQVVKFEDACALCCIYGAYSVPAEYDSTGTTTVVVVYTSATAHGSQTIDFEFHNLSVATGESLDQATGPEEADVNQTGAAPTTVDWRVEKEITLTAANIDANGTLQWKLCRDGDDAGNDTLTDDIIVFDVLLEYDE